MTAKEINDVINRGEKINVIDIRAKERFDRFHIDGALSLDKETLLAHPHLYLKPNSKTYITCNSGNSSSVIVSVLKGQGFDVESVTNGMNPLMNQ